MVGTNCLNVIIFCVLFVFIVRGQKNVHQVRRIEKKIIKTKSIQLKRIRPGYRVVALAGHPATHTGNVTTLYLRAQTISECSFNQL